METVENVLNGKSKPKEIFEQALQKGRIGLYPSLVSAGYLELRCRREYIFLDVH